MITCFEQKPVFYSRLRRFQQLIFRQSLDGAILTSGSSLFYLTGVRPDPKISAFLLIGPASSLWLELSSENSFQQAIQWFGRPGRLGVEASIPGKWLLGLQQSAPSCCWTLVTKLIQSLRLIKDQDELSAIQTAQHMAEEAVHQVIQKGLQGKTELEIARNLMDIRLEMGFDSVGTGLIASGPNTAFPHHAPGNRKIQKGDVVTVDIGGEFKGYHADMTRTFSVGPASGQAREIYHVVYKAFLAAAKAVRPGVSCAQIDQAGRQIISEHGYGACFPHGIGHGIGLDLHEEPFLSQASLAPLRPGMVFSIEPGIYLPGSFGIRIEDLFTLQEGGALLCLNQRGRGLLEVE